MPLTFESADRKEGHFPSWRVTRESAPGNLGVVVAYPTGALFIVMREIEVVAFDAAELRALAEFIEEARS